MLREGGRPEHTKSSSVCDACVRGGGGGGGSGGGSSSGSSSGSSMCEARMAQKEA